MKSNFHRDIKVEEEISAYMDKYFYEKYVEDFKRYDDESSQNLGIDVHFNWGDIGQILVDEKSNSSEKYINKFIPTFAFEIQNTRSGNIGWLIDEKKLTQYYMLIYVWATNPKMIPININQLHCILIYRSTIRNYLSNIGYDDMKLLEECNRAKHNNSSGKINTKHNEVYFFYTPWLAEAPFNIIIRRNILSSLSIAEFRITEGEINVEKGLNIY